MRNSVLFGILFFVLPIFAKQLVIKNAANLRSNEKNFFSQQNVVGRIAKGATVTVIDEKILPSGNKAYKISVAATKPASSVTNRSQLSELWVYGSSKFVESTSVTASRETEAGVIKDKCLSCSSAQTQVTAPFRPILEHLEVDSATPTSTNISQSNGSSQTALEKVNNLIKSGFSCNKSEENVKVRGYVCKGKFQFYNQNVRIYIPEKFDTTKPAKFNLFFHGLRNDDTFKENSNGSGVGDYGAMLKNANDSNSILVVPESINVKCGTSAKGESLYCPGSYYQFTKNPDLIFQLKTNIESNAGIKLGELTLSGHSAAGSIINSLLANNSIRTQVNKVALFDALYGDSSNLQSWLREDANRKLSLAWIHGAGSSTQLNTQNFINSMSTHLNQIKQGKIIGSTENTHMSIMQKGGLSDFLKNGIN